jgi:hypothetical protein
MVGIEVSNLRPGVCESDARNLHYQPQPSSTEGTTILKAAEKAGIYFPTFSCLSILCSTAEYLQSHLVFVQEDDFPSLRNGDPHFGHFFFDFQPIVYPLSLS